MKVAVSLDMDETYGFSGHNMSLPMQVLPYLLVPAVEKVVKHAWDLGAGKHAFTKTVFHRGRPIVQEGHDAGQFIADEAGGVTPWANGRKSLLEMASCRKIAFAASTVNMNGKGTGACNGELPLVTCGEPVGLPTCWPVFTTANSVHVGLNDEDMRAGYFGIGAGMLIDVACFAMSLLGGIPSGLDALGLDTTKAALNQIAGMTLSACRSYNSGWKKPITAKSELNILGGSQAIEVSFDPQSHDIKITGSGAFGPWNASRDTTLSGKR